MSSLRQLILQAFYDPVTGLTKNIAKLKERNPRLALIPADFIRETLNQVIPVYNQNKIKKKIKDFVQYNANYVGEILHADLMFLNSPRNTKQQILIQDKTDNDNKYLLIIVDTYSRFIWAHPLESKNAKEITQHIKDTIDFITDFYYGGNHLIHFKVLTDAGKEFSTKSINDIPNTKHIISKNTHGAALAESAIYKIRTKLKYLRPNLRKLKFSELIQLLNNINSESEANAILFDGLLLEDKSTNSERYPSTFEQGDYVRLAVEKGQFDKKSGLDNFTARIYVVLQVIYNEKYNVYRYKIGTTNGEYISTKKFYQEELEKVSYTYMESLSEQEMKQNHNITMEEIKEFSFTK